MATQPVKPAVTVPGADVEWYPIRGANRAEILGSLLQNGPQASGAHVAGVTRWSVHWHVPRGTDGSCDVPAIDVSRDVRVRLPAWEMPATVPQSEADAWFDYVQSLAHHEAGHVERVHTQADRLPTDLQGVPCSDIDQKGYEVLDHIEQVNRDYDETTAYGGNQGLDFWAEAALELSDELMWMVQ